MGFKDWFKRKKFDEDAYDEQFRDDGGPDTPSGGTLGSLGDDAFLPGGGLVTGGAHPHVVTIPADADLDRFIEDGELPYKPPAGVTVGEDPVIEYQPGWKRRGEPYNHFRTVKLVERGDPDNPEWKFKVRGRGGKWRFKSEAYTVKSNAKRAAVKWAKKSTIPTRFVPEQYGGQVVYDTNEQDA